MSSAFGTAFGGFFPRRFKLFTKIPPIGRCWFATVRRATDGPQARSPAAEASGCFTLSYCVSSFYSSSSF